MKYLISEIDDDACCEIPRYICNTRADAEEAILALTEEEDFVECNYGINRLGDADTLEEYVDLLRGLWDKKNCNNECITLYLGGFNYYIRTIPSLED